MAFLFDLLGLVNGWEQENVPQVIVGFFPAFDVGLDELRPIVVVGVEFVEELFHGHLLMKKRLFFDLLFHSQRLEAFLGLLGERIE